jgi:hypothetical protein
MSDSDFHDFMIAHTQVPRDEIYAATNATFKGRNQANDVFFDIATEIQSGKNDELLKKLKFWI